MDPEGNDRDDIVIAYEEQQNKKIELERVVDVLRNETIFYKKKCKSLQERLDYVNQLVKENAQVFQKLYVDSKCVLEMSRVQAFDGKPLKETSVIASSTPKPGPSHRVSIGDVRPQRTNVSSIGDGRSLRSNVRPRLHIEPMSMEELQGAVTEPSQIENHQVEPPPDEVPQEQELSAIPEENTILTTISINGPSPNASSLYNLSLDQLNCLKDLVVNVEKMPSDIFSFHLKKRSNKGNNNTSVFNSSDTLTNTIINGPGCSSTPQKVDMMKMLGLIPTKRVENNFVNVRKKKDNRSNPGSSWPVNSPKKEKSSPLKERSLQSGSFKREALKRACSGSPDYVNKRKRTNPEPASPRDTYLKFAIKRELLSTSSRISSRINHEERDSENKSLKNVNSQKTISEERGSVRKSPRKHNSDNINSKECDSKNKSSKKYKSKKRNLEQDDSENAKSKQLDFENRKPKVRGSEKSPKSRERNQDEQDYNSGRPTRKVKPKAIKEPSLREKMRRP